MEAEARGRSLRTLRAHPFVTLLVFAALLGGGLRAIPASNAATPASAAGGGSTACAAK